MLIKEVVKIKIKKKGECKPYLTFAATGQRKVRFYNQ